jgi:hypothetical protein
MENTAGNAPALTQIALLAEVKPNSAMNAA